MAERKFKKAEIKKAAKKIIDQLVDRCMDEGNFQDYVAEALEISTTELTEEWETAVDLVEEAINKIAK
jgi:predicted regulator of amino acid metabolism with ACT domain